MLEVVVTSLDLSGVVSDEGSAAAWLVYVPKCEVSGETSRALVACGSAARWTGMVAVVVVVGSASSVPRGLDGIVISRTADGVAVTCDGASRRRRFGGGVDGESNMTSSSEGAGTAAAWSLPLRAFDLDARIASVLINLTLAVFDSSIVFDEPKALTLAERLNILAENRCKVDGEDGVVSSERGMEFTIAEFPSPPNAQIRRVLPPLLGCAPHFLHIGWKQRTMALT